MKRATCTCLKPAPAGTLYGANDERNVMTLVDGGSLFTSLFTCTSCLTAIGVVVDEALMFADNS